MRSFFLELVCRLFLKLQRLHHLPITVRRLAPLISNGRHSIKQRSSLYEGLPPTTGWREANLISGSYRTAGNASAAKHV